MAIVVLSGQWSARGRASAPPERDSLPRGRNLDRSARPRGAQRRTGTLSTAGGLVFVALLDGTIAAYDETTLDELWKVNVGAGFTAPPMTFEVNGKQYIAIASGSSAVSRAKLVNTPELRDQRQATVLYVFGL